MKLTISVDDVNPKPGYRLLGEPTEKWFRQLNEEFGCRFTLFIPSCYHRQYPISEHKGWIQELQATGFCELSAHGHYHQTSNPQRFGECEFVEMTDKHAIVRRLHEMHQEWDDCEILPKGWRNPGWLCTSQSKEVLEGTRIDTGFGFIEGKIKRFEYVAVHYDHNNGLRWNCKTFFGHDGIQQENISIHNGDMIMFQSHIAGTHNHNVWNEYNYEQLHLSLTHLVEQFPNIQYKTLKECV